MINCPDRVARNPNFFSEYNYARNITYRKYKLVQVPSGYIYINTGVRKLKTTIVLKRCNSKDDSSCENFLKMKYNDLCKMMEDKDQVYTPFAEAFHPPIRCPLVKGTLYTITNATIDASGGLRLLKHVPNVLNDFWALRFEGRSNNVEVWCLELWLKFYEIKRRND
ncbi:uncharacterized protein LOC106668100 isoform X2 [Cimex lectularius]|nr:uncharacterized protein LOC106668100 isoform X2 [Cimex lectularius]